MHATAGDAKGLAAHVFGAWFEAAVDLSNVCAIRIEVDVLLPLTWACIHQVVQAEVEMDDIVYSYVQQ